MCAIRGKRSLFQHGGRSMLKSVKAQWQLQAVWLPIPQSKGTLQKGTSAGHAMEEKTSFHTVATMQTLMMGRVWGFLSRVGYMRFVCFQMWWDLHEGWLEKHCQPKISPTECYFFKYAQAGPHKMEDYCKASNVFWFWVTWNVLATNKQTSTLYWPVGDHMCLCLWNCLPELLLTKKLNWGLLTSFEVLAGHRWILCKGDVFQCIGEESIDGCYEVIGMYARVVLIGCHCGKMLLSS